MDGSAEGPTPTPADIADNATTGTPEGPKAETTPDVPPTTTPDLSVNTDDSPTEQTDSLHPVQDEGSERNEPDPERPKEIAESIIAAKIASTEKAIRADPEKKATPSENALLLAGYYAKGFPKGTYDKFDNKIPVGEKGIEVTTDAGEITVQTITGQEDKDGTITYTCDATREGETEPFTTEVSGPDLAKAHMAQNAEAIAQNFTTPEEQALVTWHAEGNDGEAPITEEQLTTMENKEIILQQQINEVLAAHIQRLEQELEGTEDKDKKDGMNRLLATLRIGLKADGEELGPWAKMKALNAIGKTAMGTPEGKQIGDLMEALEPQAKEAEDKLNALFKEAGIKDDQITKIMESSNLSDLLANGKLMKTEDMDIMLFGRKVEEDELIDMVSPLLSEAQRNWLIENKGKIGKGLLYTLIAALITAAAAVAVPTAAALATVGATSSLMNGGRRS